MHFSLAFSPCPNDTFIFDAMVNGKIDTANHTFEVHLEDVQTLNEAAIASKYHISKISYGVLPLVQNKTGYFSTAYFANASAIFAVSVLPL